MCIDNIKFGFLYISAYIHAVFILNIELFKKLTHILLLH